MQMLSKRRAEKSRTASTQSWVPIRARRASSHFRRGAAVVEFALVAPVFFLLVLGIIEVGRAMMVQQILTNASRVGARRAVMLSSDQQAVLDAVDDYVDGVQVHGVEASVSPDPASAAAGTEITVNVSVDYTDVSWVPAPWFLGGKTLTASSVMRKEGF